MGLRSQCAQPRKQHLNHFKFSWTSNSNSKNQIERKIWHNNFDSMSTAVSTSTIVVAALGVWVGSSADPVSAQLYFIDQVSWPMLQVQQMQRTVTRVRLAMLWKVQNNQSTLTQSVANFNHSHSQTTNIVMESETTTNSLYL